MATWETTASVVSWRSTGVLNKQTSVVITKITDDKDSETTFEVNETVTYTEGGGTDTATFIGSVTVDGVTYPVIRVGVTRYIVGLGESANIPASLAESALETGGPFTVCFFPGTLIATPSGERKVEELATGDLVLIGDSGTIPTTWLGRKFARAISINWVGLQTVSTLFGPAERLMPVRFAAGSLGGGATPSAA